MSTTIEIRSVLRSFESNRWVVVRDAVDTSATWLESRAGSKDEVAEVGTAFVKLARHPKWEVRRAVAHAVQHLRHETFHTANAVLLDDSNNWVKEAAEKTLARRTETTHADVLKAQQGNLLAGWLSDVEATHGRRAREAAMRVATRFSGLMARDAYHELVRVIAPLDLSLTNLKRAVGRKELDREALVALVETARGRLSLLLAILNANREFNLEVTSEFRSEELRAMVAEAGALVQDRGGGERLALKMEIAIEPAIYLDAHRHRLLQAFRNLLQNALEAYAPSTVEPWVRVEARVDDSQRVVLTFTDRGCGMSTEGMGDAFHLYSTSKDGGTGFGLPLAKKIVETEHSGSIFLSSVEDRGTTVTVVLPLHRDEGEG